MKNLYVFDFDGTLYKGDSMLDFAKFSNRKRYYLSLLVLLPHFFNYKIGLLSSTVMKEKFLTYHFKGKSLTDLNLLGLSFFKENQHKIFNKAKVYLNEIDRINSDCIIVSGSCEEWLLPFSTSLGAKLICTNLYFENSIFTGKLNNENCVGIVKVKRIQETMKLDSYNQVFVYGNSSDDFVMKSIATEYFHLYFSK